MISRRTFSKLLVSLLPASWIAGKVKAAPKPMLREKVTYNSQPPTEVTWRPVSGNFIMFIGDSITPGHEPIDAEAYQVRMDDFKRTMSRLAEKHARR